MLLRMSALSHDHIDNGFDIWVDPRGLPPDALWCPILAEAMLRGYMIAVGGMLAVTRGSGM